MLKCKEKNRYCFRVKYKSNTKGENTPRNTQASFGYLFRVSNRDAVQSPERSV